MLQESPFQPYSDCMKRAMKETERRLRELGYEVVPFFLTDDVWDQGRDFLFSSLANGVLPEAMKEANDRCESFSLNLWPINFLL